MGYTFSFDAAREGGRDAMEGEFGYGRTYAFCSPFGGRRTDVGYVPGIRHIAQNRLQDIRPLQRMRSPGAGRPASETLGGIKRKTAGGGAQQMAQEKRRVAAPSTQAKRR